MKDRIEELDAIMQKWLKRMYSQRNGRYLDDNITVEMFEEMRSEIRELFAKQEQEHDGSLEICLDAEEEAIKKERQKLRQKIEARIKELDKIIRNMPEGNTSTSKFGYIERMYELKKLLEEISREA